MNASTLINSPAMWIFSLLIVGAAITQSVIMFRLASKYIKRTEVLSGDEVKTCIRTGGVVAIGPALSVFVVALSMISMLGAPFTLMRVGMIGSASTELTAASIGTEAAGVSLGMEMLTGTAFTAALWTCAFMSCGYLIFVPLVTRGIGKALNRIIVPAEGQKPSKLAWFLSALLPLLIFCMLSFIQARKSGVHMLSMAVAAVVMLGMNILAGKLKKKWMKQWSMCVAVMVGIVVGGFAAALL